MLLRIKKQYRWKAMRLSGTSTKTSSILTNHSSKDSRPLKLGLVSAKTTHRSSSHRKTPFIWLLTVNTTRGLTANRIHVYLATTPVWPGAFKPLSVWCAARCLNRPEGKYLRALQVRLTTHSDYRSTKLCADLVKPSQSQCTSLPVCCSLSSDACAAGRTRNTSTVFNTLLRFTRQTRRKPCRSDQSLSEVVSECYKQGRKWELFCLCSSYN